MAKIKVRTKRIYYGPPGNERLCWWTVKVKPAPRNVTINGCAVEALRSHAGYTIGCSISKYGIKPENLPAWGHPVYLVSVTATKLLAVFKRKKNGEPDWAYEYDHSYSDIVLKNDKGTIKRIAAEHPEYVNKPLTFRVPRKRERGGPGYGPSTSPHRQFAEGSPASSRSHALRGCMKRAVDAGLIAAPVAEQLEQISRQTARAH